jgi:hypothetical protein
MASFDLSRLKFAETVDILAHALPAMHRTNNVKRAINFMRRDNFILNHPPVLSFIGIASQCQYIDSIEKEFLLFFPLSQIKPNYDVL